jgi:choline monooxygenase
MTAPDDLRIDANLEHARPLPGRWYTDPRVFEQEREAVFGRSWNLVGHAGQFAAAGDYASIDVAGRPLVVVRDGDELRAFHNVCRHRGGPLTAGCGRHARFTCRYHGWSYALDGRLLRAPQMADEIATRAGTLDLKPARAATWAGLVFATTSTEVPPLAEHLRELAADAAHLRLDELRFHSRTSHPVECNWKLYVDNYLEGYHVPAVHPGLSRELDFRSYVTELGARHVVQYAPIAAGDATGRVYGASATAAEAPQARYYWLYPNVMLNCYEGVLQTNVVEPLGVDRCVVHFDWYLPSGAAGDAARAKLPAMAAFSAEVQAEDAAICAALQRNASSPAFEPGAYSSRYEGGLHLFHRLYAAAIRGARDATSRGW